MKTNTLTQAVNTIVKPVKKTTKKTAARSRVAKTKTPKLVPPSPLLKALEKVTNKAAFTTNGAISNVSTLDKCLDFFAAGAAIRNRADSDVIDLFSKAFYQDCLTATKILFAFRDVREGSGERKTSRTILTWLANNYPEVVKKNLNNIPFFGRFDDLFSLFNTPVEQDVINLIASQLETDIKAMQEGKSISLAAKWMPSQNTSSATTVALARKLQIALNITPRQYRKMLSKLRAHSNVIEVKISAGEFGSINYEQVPSKASLIYRKAFNKRDGVRYKAYLGAVEKGEKKINASALYPYEIIRPIEQGGERDITALQTLDLQWKAQPNWLENNPHSGIVICDTSGSMTTPNYLPILTSVSLAIYFAERNVGPFQNRFITFSTNPTLQSITGQTIAEKVRSLNRNGWSQSTNIQGVFDLILNTAIANKVKQKDLPTYCYVISDMQFNSMTGGDTNFEVIKTKYKQAGYEMPKLVLWNINATNKDYPVTVDDKGTCLVSGCSPSILKSVLSAKMFTPVDVMMETINKERYNRVVV